MTDKKGPSKADIDEAVRRFQAELEANAPAIAAVLELPATGGTPPAQWPDFPRSDTEKALEAAQRGLQDKINRLRADLREFIRNEQSALSKGQSTVQKWAEKIVAAERELEECRPELEIVKSRIEPLERARSEAKYNAFVALADSVVKAAFDTVEAFTEPIPQSQLVRVWWTVETGFGPVRIRSERELDFVVELLTPDGKSRFGFETRVYGPQDRYEGFDDVKHEPIYRQAPAYVSWGSYSGMDTTYKARATQAVQNVAIALALHTNRILGIAEPEGF